MGSLRIGLATFAALAFLGLDPAATLGQEPSIPEEVRAQGRQLQSEARAHVDAERWALAAQTYRQVYDLGREHGLAQAPLALWNVGLALMRIPGREVEARDAFRQFLDESTALTEDPQVRDWRSTALEHIAELDARIGPPSEEEGENEAGEGEAEPNEVQAPATSGGGISPVGPVVLAAGVIALGVGGVFGALALTAESSLAERCGGLACLDTPQHRGAYDEMRTFGVVADVMLIVGGLAAITGTILTFTLTEGGGTTASAVLRPGGAEFVIGGSF